MVDSVKSAVQQATTKLSEVTTGSSKPPRIVKAPAGKIKVLMVTYEGGDAVKENPDVLAATERAWDMKDWLQQQGHEVELIVTNDKDGEQSEARKHIVDADVLITTPFWPLYATKEVLQSAKKLKLSITAGVGSDHNDLDYAADNGITVVECSGSNVVSVAEHAVMQILMLVRNYYDGHEQVVNGGWDVAKIASRSYDLEGMHIGTVAIGRIGSRILKRLQPFGVHLHYASVSGHRHESQEKELGLTFHEKVEDMVKQCDVITINCPLTKDTKDLFDKEMIGKMKDGAFLVNTARAEIVNRDALVEAVNAGRIEYSGDTWSPEPAPKDHPWRKLPRNTLTIHCSGHTIQAQKRIADDMRTVLKAYFEGTPLPEDFIMN